jgi:hypothetical protein
MPFEDCASKDVCTRPVGEILDVTGTEGGVGGIPNSAFFLARYSFSHCSLEIVGLRKVKGLHFGVRTGVG